ncbi:restriction endonuclease subunit [Sesbania bispinosa]|nr:restriction endonuclease subunit [Sesbania bispinosa]
MVATRCSRFRGLEGGGEEVTLGEMGGVVRGNGVQVVRKHKKEKRDGVANNNGPSKLY